MGREQYIQDLIENNLKEVLDIDFLATEYTTTFGGRIDTLGIDGNNSPVIIEYKKTSNENIINQGLSYLRWLLDHKAEFEKLVEKKLKKKRDTDWTQPRVICIAESYNKYDLDTADLLPINIELKKYKIYENNILSIDEERYAKVNIGLSPIISKVRKKRKERYLQKEYPLDMHLKKRKKEVKELFYKLREEILKIDDQIKEKIKKHYIAYETNKNFTEMVIQANAIKIYLYINLNELNDPRGIVEDCSSVGHWATGNSRFKINSAKQMSYAISLIKQAYESTL